LRYIAPVDKRILSLVAALVSTGVYIVSRRFLQTDPMETFVPALSGLGFVYAGLLVFQILFNHVVPAAWAYLGGLCAFGWILILWPRHWAEAWMAACAVSFLALGRILMTTDRSATRALARRLLYGQILGFAVVAGAYALAKTGMLHASINLFSPAVLLFPVFFYWGLRDADRKRAQSYIVQSAKRDTFESLVQGLAHELNNPLNFIYANLEPLRELVAELRKEKENAGRSPSEASERKHESTDGGLGGRAGSPHDEMNKIIDTMEEGVSRARGLVDRFRDFPTDAVEPKETVDVNGLVDKTVEMLSPKWKGRVQVNRRFGEIPKVAAYPLQLGQIFTNVIANACDATPEGGSVTVATSAGTTGVKVSVKDTGHGIPKDQVARIFDPFYTTKQQGEGMGLGLAITLQLVKNHKGNVEVKSEVGKGTEFLISLPYA
jgi:signal transduction histidine kinase